MVAGVIIGGVTEVACTLDTALATVFSERLHSSTTLEHLERVAFVEVVSLERICVGIFFPESCLLLDGDFHVHDEATETYYHVSTDYSENFQANLAYRSVMKRNEPDPPTFICFIRLLRKMMFERGNITHRSRTQTTEHYGAPSWHVHSCTSPVSPAGNVVKSVIHLSVSEILERMSGNKASVPGHQTDLGRH